MADWQTIAALTLVALAALYTLRTLSARNAAPPPCARCPKRIAKQ